MLILIVNFKIKTLFIEVIKKNVFVYDLNVFDQGRPP